MPSWSQLSAGGVVQKLYRPGPEAALGYAAAPGGRLCAMTTLAEPQTRPGHPCSDRAATVAPVLAEHAGRHDVDGTFVSESLDALRDAGLLAAGRADRARRPGRHHRGARRSPARAGAPLRLDRPGELDAPARRGCFTAWRYRRGMPGAEATLRKVAEDGIVLVSTGGGDWTHPRGEAVRVDGGYRVTARKRFASQSTVGTVMSTMFGVRRPGAGPAGAQPGRSVRVGGRRPCSTTGTRSACVARRATTSCSRTCSCPTSGCWPTGPTA